MVLFVTYEVDRRNRYNFRVSGTKCIDRQRFGGVSLSFPYFRPLSSYHRNSYRQPLFMGRRLKWAAFATS